MLTVVLLKMVGAKVGLSEPCTTYDVAPATRSHDSVGIGPPAAGRPVGAAGAATAGALSTAMVVPLRVNPSSAMSAPRSLVFVRPTTTPPPALPRTVESR